MKTTDDKYKQFVRKRVVEIRKNSNVKDWEYMKGKENIPDLASRDCYLNTLECIKKWFNGTVWLLPNKGKRPTKNLGQNEDKDGEADVDEIQRGEGTAVYFKKNDRIKRFEN